MYQPSLRARLAALLVCGIPVSPSIARDLTLPELQVSFSLPSAWKHQVSQEPGRTSVLLKPNVDEKPSVALRCSIDRHELPARFKDYTQAQLNDAYKKKPLSREAFAAQLSQQAGTPVFVEQTGEASLGTALAYWALSTATQTAGGTTANFKSKTYLAQTPGYAWNVQCSVAVTGPDSVGEIYRLEERQFEALLSSVQLK